MLLLSLKIDYYFPFSNLSNKLSVNLSNQLSESLIVRVILFLIIGTYEPYSKFLRINKVKKEKKITPICSDCQNYHYGQGTITCDAFPKGIPQKIWIGEIDHRKPVSGDSGIRINLLLQIRLI